MEAQHLPEDAAVALLLAQVNNDLLHADSPTEILNAVSILAERFHAFLVTLNLLQVDANNQPDIAETVAALGRDGYPFPLSQMRITRFYIKDYPAIVQLLAQSDAPYFIEDMPNDPTADESMRHYARKVGYTAIIALPLRAGHRWLGFLSFLWDTPQIFSRPLRELFASLQLNTAAVLGRYLAFRAESEARLESQILYRIGNAVNSATSYMELLEAICTHSPFHRYYSSLALFEGGDVTTASYAEIVAVFGALKERQGTRVPRDQFSGTDYYARKVFAENDLATYTTLAPTHANYLHDAIRMKALLALTLNLRDKVIGTLSFFSNQLEQYSEFDKRLASGVADLSIAAIERIRLREVEIQAQHQAHTVARINTALSLATDEHSILAAVALAMEDKPPDVLYLGYFENTSANIPDYLHTVGIWTHGNPVAIQGTGQIPVQFSETLQAKRWDENPDQIFFIEDAETSADVNEVSRLRLRTENIRAVIVLPLCSGGEWHGVLTFNWRTRCCFTPTDRAILAAILAPLSAVIARRRAYLAQHQVIEKLRELDRLKDEFLSNMSHELRTPLNAIIGLSDVILSGLDGEINPRTRSDVQTIFDSGQQLLAIVNDILDIAKIEAGTMILNRVPINLYQPIQEALNTAKIMAHNKNLRLKASIPEQLPKVSADANRIRQVLLNLLSNAIKFTDQGEVCLGVKDDRNRLIISVRDTGIGIPKSYHRTIFEQFRQVDGALHRRKGGTGLGLAICKRLIELHGGTIWLESKPGEGSIFYFTLPLG
ncbi:MAG: hypothetical protein OHK0023_20610 [Anaerolineae bacterium]